MPATWVCASDGYQWCLANTHFTPDLNKNYDRRPPWLVVVVVVGGSGPVVTTCLAGSVSGTAPLASDEPGQTQHHTLLSTTDTRFV